MANPLTYGLHYNCGRTAGGVEGDYSLALGDFDADKIDEISSADYVAFDQDIDVTDVDYVLMWVKGEIHQYFSLDIIFDGTIERAFVAGEPFISKNVFMPVAINVSGMTGTKNLKFRLLRIV